MCMQAGDRDPVSRNAREDGVFIVYFRAFKSFEKKNLVNLIVKFYSL